MNFSTYSLYVGNNRAFTEYKGYGDYVTLRTNSHNVKWSISDTDILEFKSISGGSAEVRAIRTGFAYVSAEHKDGRKELCHISVIDNYARLTAQRIEFNIDNLILKLGAEARVIPILYPKEVYNNGMLDTTLRWSSSDTEVAEVKNGIVTAVGEGTAVITAVSADVARTASFNVTVSADAAVCDIKAAAAEVEAMTVGEKLRLNAESKGRIVWTSDNSLIADVDENGLVTAYSSSNRLVVSEYETYADEMPDTVTIYATAVEGGKTAEFKIRVNNALSAVHSVDINKKKITVVNGKSSYITAVITPANILEKKINWLSNNEDVVSISTEENTADGVNRARLIAKSAGTAYITAEYGGKSDKCLVTVTADEIKIKEITMPAKAETEVDRVSRMSVKITENAADSRLMWLGTDDDIATVDRDGNVMGYRTGEISVYAIAHDSLTPEQTEEIKQLKRSGKRQFSEDELRDYLKVYAVCRLTVKDNTPSLRNVHIPPETVTYNSVNILWSRAALCDVAELDRYIIYINGKSAAETKKLGYTANGLAADTEYDFMVKAVDCAGRELAAKSITIKTKNEPVKIINVLDCGARGDGRVLDTYAIQRAIDKCPTNGEVVLPGGYVFLSGALFLKSDMTFRVDGILIGSINPKDYPSVITRWEGWRKLPQTAEEWDNTEDNPEKPYMRQNRYQHASFINAGTYNEDAPGTVSPCNARNITICGKGQINSNGFALAYNEGPNWKRHKENDFYRAFPPVKNPTLRGRTLAMNNAESIYIKDVQISYAPSWTTHFIFCNSVTFDNLSVISQGKGNAGDGCDLHNCVHIYNGDGIDPEDCTYVNIFNTYFRTGDDTVTLKSGRNREGNELDKPNAYIRVTDCLSSWSLGGFGTGSEDASGSHDLLYQNLNVQDAEIFGYWFKTNPARGCISENVQVRDCHAEGVRAVLVFSHEYPSGQNNPASGLPVQRYFKIENVSGVSSEYSIRLNGLNEKSITDISLREIHCDSPGGVDITKCNHDLIRWLD